MGHKVVIVYQSVPLVKEIWMIIILIIIEMDGLTSETRGRTYAKLSLTLRYVYFQAWARDLDNLGEVSACAQALWLLQE